jgi:hypothetical protein
MLFDKLKDTTLKSLKFGGTKTKGDSIEPYVVTDINSLDNPDNPPQFTKFDDGFIRGGVTNAFNSSITDTKRIFKFFADPTKGPLFIAKQAGLQLSNPPLETRKLSVEGEGTLANVTNAALSVVNKANSLFGGNTRIYNLGINTLAQVPLAAFGGHIVRHGFLPIKTDDQKYESVVTFNNKNTNANRLVELRKKFFLFNKRIKGKVEQADPNELKIKTSFGGSDSLYGVGFTSIHRTTFTGDGYKFNESLDKSKSKTGGGNYPFLLKVEPQSTDYTTYRKAKFDTQVKNLNALIDANKSKPTGSILIGDFGKLTKVSPIQPTDARTRIASSLNLTNRKFQLLVTNEIVPNSDKPILDSTKLSDKYAKLYEKINEDPKTTKEIVKKDQIKSITFKINKPTNLKGTIFDYGLKAALDIKDFNRDDDGIMTVVFNQLDAFSSKGTKLGEKKFKAFITGYNESHDSSWDSIKYNGRSEFFYTFNSYKKTASFKLKIPSFNSSDLKTNHENLKSLQQGLAGEYYNFQLGGIITYISLGYYISDEPCIINSMNISIPDDVSWDIDTKQSMMLEATFNITILGNTRPGLEKPVTTSQAFMVQ